MRRFAVTLLAFGLMLSCGDRYAFAQDKAKDTDIEVLKKQLADETARSAYLVARANRSDIHAQADSALGGRLTQAEQAEQNAGQALIRQLGCTDKAPFNAQTLSCVAVSAPAMTPVKPPTK